MAGRRYWKELFELRRSARHGRGAFAIARIPAYTAIIEYTGELISEAEGDRRYPSRPDDSDGEHTFLLELAADRVIDANVGGNAARYINHSCEPNVEPIAFGDHMWIVATRDIKRGEELAYDYAIELDERHTPAVKARFPCRCGARRCRGSILKPKGMPLHRDVRRTLRRLARLRNHGPILRGGERLDRL